MKRVLPRLALLAALAVPALAQSLEVQLELSPGATLPALPVAMRVSVKNISAAPVTVASPMSVTMTDSGGSSVTASVSLPAAWAPGMSRRGRYTLAAGATLECIAPIDPFLAENELFLVSAFPLWKPGLWSVTATVFTTDGGNGTSNAATLTINTLGGDDAAIWQTLSGGGQSPFSSQTLLESFEDVIADYPSSQYYRHLAPFVLNQRDRDDDRYASNLTLAVQSLPAAYVDGARLAIAQRYADRAMGDSAGNRQKEAGQWSAKGRDGDAGSPPPPDDVCVATLVGHNVELRLAEGETILGRERGLRDTIDDPSVSRHHAAAVCTRDSCVIRDLGSKNGTFVGGVRISAPRELRDSDLVELGNMRLIFHRAQAQSTITVTR